MNPYRRGYRKALNREKLKVYAASLFILALALGVGVGITLSLMAANPFLVMVGAFVAVPLTLGAMGYIASLVS